MKTKCFLLLFALSLLPNDSLLAWDVAMATTYANMTCGAILRNTACPFHEYPNELDNPWYSEHYSCYQTSDWDNSHCEESMEFWAEEYSNDNYLNCELYDINYNYSDCANYISQILQVGCGGLCQHVWPHCPDYEHLFYANNPIPQDGCDCHAMGECVGNRFQVYPRVKCWLHSTSLDYGILLDTNWEYITWSNGFLEGDIAVMDTDYDNLYNHIVYMVDDDLHYRGHTRDRCECNQMWIDGTYRVYRPILSWSYDPLYRLDRNPH